MLRFSLTSIPYILCPSLCKYRQAVVQIWLWTGCLCVFKAPSHRDRALSHMPDCQVFGCRYVTGKDLRRNAVYITRTYYEENRIRNAFHCGNFSWTMGHKPDLSDKGPQLTCKIRHGPTLYNCSMAMNQGGTAADVRLEGNDQGLAPGQSAVFYQGSMCLGTGTILDAAQCATN